MSSVYEATFIILSKVLNNTNASKNKINDERLNKCFMN